MLSGGVRGAKGSRARACPCIDAIPIPAETNEMAILQRCVCELPQAYEKLDLFGLLATDAGRCSQDSDLQERRDHPAALAAASLSQPALV